MIIIVRVSFHLDALNSSNKYSYIAWQNDFKDSTEQVYVTSDLHFTCCVLAGDMKSMYATGDEDVPPEYNRPFCIPLSCVTGRNRDKGGCDVNIFTIHMSS